MKPPRKYARETEIMWLLALGWVAGRFNLSQTRLIHIRNKVDMGTKAMKSKVIEIPWLSVVILGAGVGLVIIACLDCPKWVIEAAIGVSLIRIAWIGTDTQ